jgi:hypothetical protein
MVGILVHGDNHFIVCGSIAGSRRCTSTDSTLVHHSDWSDNRTLAHLDNRCFTSLGLLLSKVSLLTRSGSLN